MPSQQQRDEGDTGAARRGPNPLVCEMFQGIQTVTDRSGVPDQNMFWCDGFMPIAPRKLRTLYGIGSRITPTPGVAVMFFDFYNIGAQPYAVAFLADGSAIQINLTDLTQKTILPPTTILSPTVNSVGVTQYGSQYLVIVSNQTNGYWVWDGQQLFGAGTLAPLVTMTNVGSGYVSPPVVTASGGHGSGATFSAQINAVGQVVSVTMTNPGSGYLAGDVVTLVFTGGNQSGSGASLTPVMAFSGTGSGASFTYSWTQQGSDAGQPVYFLSSVTLVNGGSGYSAVTLVHVTGGQVAQDGHDAVLSFTITGGVITAVSIVNGGGFWHPGSVVATDTGFFKINSVTINSGGSLYSTSATVTVSGGAAPSGASTPTQAAITLQISGGNIIGTNITNPGIYGAATPLPVLTVNDSAVTAAGTVELMPLGVKGNAVQTYASHVWVFDGKTVSFTAPGSVSDFSTANGGGQFVSSDNFLRVGYTAAVQTNGFLFIIGDSSMNYISGVQTNTPQGGTPTTTFTNNNSDPEIGTPYPASVLTFEQDIMLANSAGIFVSSGGTFVKKSTPLDGVYNSVPNFNGQQLSAAKATIFGQRVWLLLAPLVDPITYAVENRMWMFNGQFWWSSPQDVPLTYICGQEINSVFTAWGTDGVSIFKLFVTPTTGFQKTMQTRLWDAPAGYDHTKSSVRLFSMARFFGQANLSYQIFIDNEFGVPDPPAQPYTATPTPFFWQTTGGAPYLWHTTGGATFLWGVASGAISVMPPTAIGQVGVLTGMTTLTTCDDMVLISEMIQDEIVQYRG